MVRRYSSRAIEVLVWFDVLFGPWAFGATQDWAIWVMNGVGYALGLLWLARQFNRQWRSLYQTEPAISSPQTTKGQGTELFFRRALLAATASLLLYCLVAALNARADYRLWHFNYLSAVTWLPHTYDQHRSWFFFWKYLGLAGLFWGMRDWLMEACSGSSKVPRRVRRLLWLLALNGVLMAVVGLIQRLTGQNKLLWLVEPDVNKSVTTQFAAFAYRGNGAQYFNLVWPVALGLWLYLKKSGRRTESGRWGKYRGPGLLAGVLIMALCPFVSLSRTGATILVINLILSGIIIGVSLGKGFRWKWLWIVLAMFGVIGTGLYLQWDALLTRFSQLELGYYDRMSLFIPEWQMVMDNQPFGVGPGAFSTMYQFYRFSFADNWWEQAHNDWLEALITFGWVGTLICLLPFGLILARSFYRGGIRVRRPVIFLLWLALGSSLAHACVDFPFQIESILVLFTMECCLLSVFTAR